MTDAIVHEPPHTSGGAKGFLTKKVGPLSIGMYLLFFVGFLIIYYWWRSRSTSGGNAPTPTTFTGDLQGTSASQGMGSASGGGAFGGAQSSGSGSASATNGQWATNAANFLTGNGANPTAVQGALAAYLSGQQLTPSQQALIDQALSAEGSPPNGVVPANTASQSVAYSVTAGDTLTSIAQMFYGDPSRWRDIYAANMSVFGPNANLSTPLHGGMTLTIPGNGLLPEPGARDSYSGVPTGHKYTLQFGDSLIQLAERFYGDGTKWPLIAAANPKLIPDVNHPLVGTTITIPSAPLSATPL